MASRNFFCADEGWAFSSALAFHIFERNNRRERMKKVGEHKTHAKLQNLIILRRAFCFSETAVSVDAVEIGREKEAIKFHSN